MRGKLINGDVFYAAVSPAEVAEVLDPLKREKQRREGKTVNAPDGARRREC